MGKVYSTNRAAVNSVNGQSGAVTLGGTNLIPGSKDFYNAADWKFLNQWTPDGTYKGLSVYKKSSLYYGYGYPISLEPGTYTFSAWAKAEGCHLGIVLDGIGEMIFPEIYTDWTRISRTVTITEAGEYCLRVQTSETGTIWVCGHKLERGNAATDWSPAPEDVDATRLKTDLSNLSSGAVLPVENGGTGIKDNNLTFHAFHSNGNITLRAEGPASMTDDELRVIGITMRAGTRILTHQYCLGPNRWNNYDIYTTGNKPTAADVGLGDVRDRLAAIEAQLGITADPPVVDGPSMEEDMDMDEMRQAGGYYDLYIVSLLPALIGGVRHG